MVTGCPKCGMVYNDENRWTLCPHGPLGYSHDDYCPKCDTLKSVHGLCPHQMGIKEMKVDQVEGFCDTLTQEPEKEAQQEFGPVGSRQPFDKTYTHGFIPKDLLKDKEITEDGEIGEDPQPEPEGARNNFPSDPSYVTHIDVAVIQGDVELQRDRMESATALILQSPGLHIKQGKIGQALEATLIMAMEFLQREFSTNLPNVSEGPAIILGVNPDDPEAPKMAPHYCPGTGEETILLDKLPICGHMAGGGDRIGGPCLLGEGHTGYHQDGTWVWKNDKDTPITTQEAMKGK